jgi:hypothetical protein
MSSTVVDQNVTLLDVVSVEASVFDGHGSWWNEEFRARILNLSTVFQKCTRAAMLAILILRFRI